MLAELKTAYAEVHQEAVQHKQQAEASQAGSKHLANALGRLKESQAQLIRQERLHVLEQIIKGVTHDLNDSLMPILGTSELLVSYYADELHDREAALEHIKTINRSVKRARRTVKNLASFCYTKHEPVASVPVDLNQLVETAVAMTQPRWQEEARSKGVTIEVLTNLQMVPAVAGEETELRDVLINLISNSIEAMPRGGTISISTHTDSTWVALEVKDNGKGMSPEVRARCLEPFYSTKEQEGTGMGLTIVSGTVQRHGGKFRLQSNPGRGAQVTIELPVWTKVATGEEIVGGRTTDSNSLRVLIIDDELWSRETLGKALKSIGHVIETAGDGKEGLRKFDEQPYDVIILDRAMPGMGGDEVAVGIKEKNPAMPVVMLTGFGDLMIQEGDQPEGVDTVLSKPITLPELRKALAQAVAR
jgi:signal transduction histidine kinase